MLLIPLDCDGDDSGGFSLGAEDPVTTTAVVVVVVVPPVPLPLLLFRIFRFGSSITTTTINGPLPFLPTKTHKVT